jgi:hypothetical protein
MLLEAPNTCQAFIFSQDFKIGRGSFDDTTREGQML